MSQTQGFYWFVSQIKTNFWKYERSRDAITTAKENGSQRWGGLVTWWRFITIFCPQLHQGTSLFRISPYDVLFASAAILFVSLQWTRRQKVYRRICYALSNNLLASTVLAEFPFYQYSNFFCLFAPCHLSCQSGTYTKRPHKGWDSIRIVLWISHKD